MDPTPIQPEELGVESLPVCRRWLTRQGVDKYDLDEGRREGRLITEWLVRGAKRPKLCVALGGDPGSEAAAPGPAAPTGPHPGNEKQAGHSPDRARGRTSARRGRRPKARRRRQQLTRDREVVECEQAWPVSVLGREWRLTISGHWERRYLTRWRNEFGTQAYINKWARQGYVVAGQTPVPDRPGVFEIRWEDRWEPRHVFTGKWDLLIEEFERTLAEGGPAQSTECARDADRTGSREWRPPKLTDPARTRVSLAAVNPDTAIHADGRFRLLLGPLPGREEDDERRVVRCYCPDGSLAGTLREDRTRHLWRRWCAARRPEDSPDPGAFASDIARLLTRYGGDIKNHWATYDALMQAFRVVGKKKKKKKKWNTAKPLYSGVVLRKGRPFRGPPP